jgi:hypothetical protein
MLYILHRPLYLKGIKPDVIHIALNGKKHDVILVAFNIKSASEWCSRLPFNTIKEQDAVTP